MKNRIVTSAIIVLVVLISIFFAIWRIGTKQVSDSDQLTDQPADTGQHQPTSKSTAKSVTTERPVNATERPVEKMSDPRESDIDDQDAIDEQEVKKEIDDAIAFLENLEKQDYQESSEELLELVKEGIAYHDDLLCSGSADFSIEFWGSLDQLYCPR